MDDFNVGQKYQLPITCIVDEKGNLNNDAEKFCGLNVLKDANDLIIEDLEKNNLLLLKEKYKHRYPYDWRTKKPTIFRATEQWFASVEGFRSSALKAIEDVEWMPCRKQEKKEFIQWLLEEEIGVFLGKGHGESQYQFSMKKMGKKYYLIVKLLIIYKIYFKSMEQIFGGTGMRKNYYQKNIKKNLIVGKRFRYYGCLV